jgi:hypothetical protein
VCDVMHEEAKWKRRTLPSSMREGIRLPWHVGRRRPAVTNAGALSSMSVVTAS